MSSLYAHPLPHRTPHAEEVNRMHPHPHTIPPEGQPSLVVFQSQWNATNVLMSFKEAVVSFHNLNTHTHVCLSVCVCVYKNTH